MWYERIMFRVPDAVKFGASGVCPICNSAFVSSVTSTREQPPDRLLKQKPHVFIEGAR
jgi:hypothetical protein